MAAFLASNQRGRVRIPYSAPKLGCCRMACLFLDKWKCDYCSLRDCVKITVVKCVESDGTEKDCGMPIQIRFNGKVRISQYLDGK